MDPVTTASTENNVTDWPGAFKVYKPSKAIIKPNAWLIVGTYLLFYVISIVLGLVLGGLGGHKSTLGVVAYELIATVLGTVQLSIFSIIYLKSFNREKASLDSALKLGLPYTLKMFGLILLIFLSYAASLLLLIVPVFFVIPRLTLAPFFLVDKNMGVMEAYKASWNQTKGHAGKVWGIFGVLFLLELLAITIIGLPFALYMIVMFSGSFVILYKYITGDASGLAFTE